MLAAEVYLLFIGDQTFLNILTTLIIDITSLVIHIEVLSNAVGVRRLRKREAKA